MQLPTDLLAPGGGLKKDADSEEGSGLQLRAPAPLTAFQGLFDLPHFSGKLCSNQIKCPKATPWVIQCQHSFDSKVCTNPRLHRHLENGTTAI